MSHRPALLNLPPLAVTFLSGGVCAFMIAVSVQVAKSSNLALKVANTQVVTGTSAEKLQELASQLEQQARVIEQKELAYSELEEVYNQSLKGKEGYGKLQNAIEAVEDLPQVSNIEEIQSEISETESQLLKINSDSVGF